MSSLVVPPFAKNRKPAITPNIPQTTILSIKLTALKVGQEIREELSDEHQAKKGTPTMGGVLILVAVFLSTVLWARLDSLYLWLALGATTAFGVIGFLTPL